MNSNETEENQTFVFGKKGANPAEKSVSGFKAAYCLQTLKNVQGSLLEVGCGGGQFLRMLRNHRKDLTLYGVDLDQAAVDYASQDKGVTIACASAEKLPFESETFATVIGFDILEHVKNPYQAVQEAYRVLKKGGTGFFYVPCEGNKGCIYKILGNHDRKRRQIGHIQQFTSDHVIQLFEKANFSIINIRHTDYLIGQIFDYLFFRQLERSTNPAALWAAQGLELKKGEIYSHILYWVRVMISFTTWCEWNVRTSKRGSMGVIVTMEKN